MTVIGENLDSVAQPLLEIMVSSASLNYSETFLAVSLFNSILPFIWHSPEIDPAGVYLIRPFFLYHKHY